MINNEWFLIYVKKELDSSELVQLVKKSLGKAKIQARKNQKR
jgi:hypothetical protein|tara:strand:- start:130 stop:255 length:126 start_codon:yes stop_codon:yes gene_type:complete